MVEICEPLQKKWTSCMYSSNISKASDIVIDTYFVHNLNFQALSHKTLVMLMGIDPSHSYKQPLPIIYPKVTFAYTKHMWRAGQKVIS